MVERATAKTKAANLSLAYNATLFVLKLGAAIVTGSISLLSEALHSATDIVSSLFAFFAVRVAAAPPDDEHPYGHGKVESLASFGESLLLVAIACYIAVEGVLKLLHPHPIHQVSIGYWIMGFSIVSSALVARYVARIARETRSLALLSNSQHLSVDLWTSVGVLIALLISSLTGLPHFDAIAALLLSVWMVWGAWGLGHRAFHELIDRRLPDEEIELIKQLAARQEGIISFHRLRTRHSGDTKYVDLHVVVPHTWSVVEAHEAADRLEKEIRDALAPAVIVVHVDPFDPAKAQNPLSSQKQ